MKKNYALRSFSLGLIVLATMLLQSLHAFHHLEEDFSKPKCHHHYGKNQTQFTHSHELDHCFVCEFTFSNFDQLTLFQFDSLKNKIQGKHSFCDANQTFSFFKGSLFSLRAPPAFIV